MSDQYLIDFNARIIPEPDELPDAADHIMDMLDVLTACGVSAAVLTSVYDPEHVEAGKYLARRDRAAAALAPLLRRDGRKYYFGTEILLHPRLLTLPELDRLTVAGTRTLIVTMPSVRWTDDLLNTLTTLVGNGYDVLVTHAERCDRRSLDVLTGLGVRLTVSAGVFGTFRLFLRFRPSRRRLRRMIREGKIVGVCSDVGRTSGNPEPGFRRLMKRLREKGRAALFRSSSSRLKGAVPIDRAFPPRR